MRASLCLGLLALTLFLGGCTLVDVRMAPRGGDHNHAFIGGYVDAGWPASDSLLQVGLFDGPSRGALVYLQLWKLLRVEVGFLGAALGVGPLDAGFGLLLYDPHPPAYVEDEQGHAHDHEHEHGHEHGAESGEDCCVEGAECCEVGADCCEAEEDCCAMKEMPPMAVVPPMEGESLPFVYGAY